MRAIDAYELKRSLAVSALIEDQKTLEQIIDEQPTIEPERKKGKWHSRIYSKIEMFVCSECQHEYSYDAETGEQFYNYCTNCGSYNGGDTWGH